MKGELHDLLSRDHDRLDGLLTDCLQSDGTIDEASYAEFRRGLLRHIGIEERVLMPAVRKRQRDSALQRQLHRDHAALAALLVPPPSAAEIHQIRSILAEHNPLEEDPGGFYDVVESIEDAELIAAVRTFPQVPVAPFSDTPLLRRTIEQLVREARAEAGEEIIIARVSRSRDPGL